MNCATARDQLLTADPSLLQGERDSDLSRHLSECDRCRAIGGMLLAAQRALHGELLATPATDATRAARLALRAAQRRRARFRVGRWVTPLAAAAGLAALLLARQGPESISETPRPPAETLPRRVMVTAPPGRSVAIMQTDDANVVIIWFF